MKKIGSSGRFIRQISEVVGEPLGLKEARPFLRD